MQEAQMEEIRMRNPMLVILAALALCLAAMIGPADAKELIFTEGYNAVEVIDTDSDEIVATIPIDGFVRETVWTRDNKFMYVTGKRHIINKIDLQQLKVVKTFDANQDGWKRNIWGFVLANDGKSAYINSIDRKVDGGEVLVRQTISQIDLDNGKVLRSMTAPWGVATLIQMQNGKMLYALGQDLHKIDIAQKEMKMVATIPLFNKGVNILPIWHHTRENGGIFMANYYTPQFMGLLSIDTSSGVVTETPIKGPPVMAYSFAYSADRKKAYGIMEDLIVLDLETNSIARILANAEGTSYSAIPTRDGKKLYVGAGGSTITVYDAETLKVLKVLQTHADAVSLRKVSY